jgi:hypothetical protein
MILYQSSYEGGEATSYGEQAMVDYEELVKLYTAYLIVVNTRFK